MRQPSSRGSTWTLSPATKGRSSRLRRKNGLATILTYKSKRTTSPDSSPTGIRRPPTPQRCQRKSGSTWRLCSTIRRIFAGSAGTASWSQRRLRTLGIEVPVRRHSASPKAWFGGLVVFAGRPDEFAVYERALTSIEIRSIYEAGVQASGPRATLSQLLVNGGAEAGDLSGWSAGPSGAVGAVESFGHQHVPPHR